MIGGNPFNSPYMAQALRREEELAKMGITPQQMQQMRQQRSVERQFEPNAQDIATIAAGEGMEGGNLSRAREMAAAMRGREMPKGKTVGPSGIYVENPYEQVGAAIERLGGGLLDRKAGQYEKNKVEPRRQALAKATAAEAARKEGLKNYQVLQTLSQGDRGLDLREKGQESDNIFRNLNLQTTVEQKALDRGLSRDLQSEQLAVTVGEGEANRGLTREQGNLNRQSRADIAQLGILSSEAMQDADRKFKERMQTATTEAAIKAATTAYERETQAAAKARQDSIDASWEPISFRDGNVVKTLAVNDAGEYRLGTSEGRKLEPYEVVDLVPYKAGAETGSAPDAANAALVKAQRQILMDDTSRTSALDRTAGQINDVLMNIDDLETYAGALNVPRALAKLGIGEEAWKAQTMDMKLKGLALDGIAKYAAVFKPMSDVDVRTIMESMPSLDNEPLTIIGYYQNEGLDQLEEIYQSSRAAATDSGDKGLVEKMDAAWQKMSDDITKASHMAAAQAGMDPAEAAKRGFDEELLRAMQGRL